MANQRSSNDSGEDEDNESDAVVVEETETNASEQAYHQQLPGASNTGGFNTGVPNLSQLPGNIGTGNMIIVGDINISQAAVLHLGTSYTINPTSGFPRNKPPKEKVLPSSYTGCKTRLNLCLAIFVSKFFTDANEVLILGKKLDMKSEAKRHNMAYSCIGIREVTYHLLMNWIQKSNGRALVKDLATALWTQDKKDTVKKLYKFMYEYPELLSA